MSSPTIITFKYKNGDTIDLECRTNYSLKKLTDMCCTDLQKENIESDSFIEWLLSNQYYVIKN
jgi:hypothetical protein